MIVQELMELLETKDPSATVVLARDPEGNAYAPVEDMSDGYFNTKTSDVFEDDDFFKDDEDESDSYEEDTSDVKETLTHGVPAVVLWPGY